MGGTTWTSKLQKLVKSLFKMKGLQYLPECNRFTEVLLQVEGEEIPRNVSPKADCAGRCGDLFVFVELDVGEGVSHNVAKYFYYFDRLQHKPRSVFLFHILGPGFLISQSNYLFYRKLAEFLAEEIKMKFKNSFNFTYMPSKPFEDADEASVWLKNELDKLFS